MSVLNSAGFYTAGPGDTCDRAPIVITRESATVMQQTLARMSALGPWAPFVCESQAHPRFVTEQQAKASHACPICGAVMKREPATRQP